LFLDALCLSPWELFLQMFRSLLEREFTEREFYIHFHRQRVQTHKIVNDLAFVRTVVEQSGLQYHLLRVKADPFVRTRIVVMPPNPIFLFPRKIKLKIMAGNFLANCERAWILRHCAEKITGRSMTVR